MSHHLYFHIMLILVLWNLSCYSSPISYVDQNEQEQALSPTGLDDQDLIKSSIVDKYQYIKILCVLDDDCYNKYQHDLLDTAEMKSKRLASNLFRGIPKFGKRAFSSAFSGIPKFG